MKYFSYTLLFFLLFSSCGKDADDIDNNFGQEVINGFVVNWDRQTTEEQRDAITEILNDMVFVEGGTFMMGATSEQVATGETRDNEFPAHFVQISGFYICKHEFDFLKKRKLYWNYYNSRYSSLSWFYYNEVVLQLRSVTGLNFDFPTEAQWEFSARGGNLSKGYVYPGSNNLLDVWGGKEDSSTPLFSSMPNELGIYNMADGRTEWCKDFYSEYSSKEILQINPMVALGEFHVIRGGAYSQSKPHKTSYSSQTFQEYEEKRWRESINYPLNDQSSCRTTFRSSGNNGASSNLQDNTDISSSSTIRLVINIGTK